MKYIKLFEQFDENDPFGEESKNLDATEAKKLMTALNMNTNNGHIMIKVVGNNIERFLKGMTSYYPELIFPKYWLLKDYKELYFLKIGEVISVFKNHYYNGKNFEYYTMM